ncbi:hypothetical protein EHQ58_10060 [Leptospira ognonensis]|uniref:DUF6933 domain-containing protein n=1 Tax=Leptospira ognonensis TaxID=2484945 RepID=A0A4V3JR53_9LEPT|nr:hypothetical protein [Leptospira ognonensis]TGL58655.1 hypothetical protein EHQ58_10060 [Leptospira ognonensis]
MLIHCTFKLRKELRSLKSDSQNIRRSGSFLDFWYANLITIGRRKCVLFANEETLLHFLIPGTKQAEIQNLPDLFRRHLIKLLKHEEIPDPMIEAIKKESLDFQICGATNRSVLGSMNDIAKNYKGMILEQGGIDIADISSIICELNRMPMTAIEMQFPIDAFRGMMRKQMIHLI